MTTINGTNVIIYQDLNNLYDVNMDVGNIEYGTIENLAVDTILPINNATITMNGNLHIPSPYILNGTALNAINAINFTGSLSGDVYGPQTATQISPGCIVDADISASAAIEDTKLATISTTGKVANSATTATSSNTDGTIVLRNNTSGTSFGLINTGNITMNTGYDTLLLTGGNSLGSLNGCYAALGDGIHLSYNNYYYNNSNTLTIPSPAGYTSRLTVGYGTISLCAGVANTAPTEYLRVDASKNISALNGALFVGDLTGNCSGSSSTFTGLLSGNVSGPMNATVINAGVVTNAMLAGSIADSKLLTISTAGKVANSATTATASNTNGTIVLRDNTAGTSFGDIKTGNITMNVGYDTLMLTGGFSYGTLNTCYSSLGDGLHMSYNNYYYNNSATLTIPYTSQSTSRITTAFGIISLCAGAVNTAPTEYLRIDFNKNISALNGATFVGPLTGNVTGDVNANYVYCNILTSSASNINVYRNLDMNNLALYNVSQIQGWTSGDMDLVPGSGKQVYIPAAGLMADLYLKAPTISTHSGDIAINPVGSNINCSSKNLTSVASISVSGNATIGGNASISGNATITGNASAHTISIVTGGNYQGAVSILSGVSSGYMSLTIGRNVVDFELGIPAVTGNFSIPAVPGDIVFRNYNPSNAILTCVGAGNSYPTTYVYGPNIDPIVGSVPGSFYVNGGAQINGQLIVTSPVTVASLLCSGGVSANTLTATTSVTTPSITSSSGSITLNNNNVTNAVINNTNNNVTSDRVRVLNTRNTTLVSLTTSYSVIISLTPPTGNYLVMFAFNATTTSTISINYGIWVGLGNSTLVNGTLVNGLVATYGDSFNVSVSSGASVSIQARLTTSGVGSVQNSYINLIPMV